MQYLKLLHCHVPGSSSSKGFGKETRSCNSCLFCGGIVEGILSSLEIWKCINLKKTQPDSTSPSRFLSGWEILYHLFLEFSYFNFDGRIRTGCPRLVAFWGRFTQTLQEFCVIMANRKKKLFSYCVGKRGLLIHYVGNWLTCLKQIMHFIM